MSHTISMFWNFNKIFILIISWKYFFLITHKIRFFENNNFDDKFCHNKLDYI